MKARIALNPTAPSAEGSYARVLFVNRTMSLTLEQTSYKFSNEMTIVFDSPEQMIELANTLSEVAGEAKHYFKKNP